jgi:hypothetical protein
MKKKTIVGLLSAFVGVLIVYLVISVAAAGYKFGQFLAS